VLTVLAPGEALSSPVQVMARVPGVPFIAASSRPWGITELMVRLGVAHAELHRLGSPPADVHPGKVPDNWLRLTRHLAESGDAGPLAASLRTIELVGDRLEVADPVVCHGDFHPGNVLAAPGGSVLHVIDWTNVGVGDRHGDIAWTLLWFEIAAVAAPRPAARMLVRMLRRRLQRAYLIGYRPLALHRAVREAGADSTYHLLAGTGHGMLSLNRRQARQWTSVQVLTLITEFLDRTLRS
jgi:aminoglycoside phosphotransferase (APT) family kinase protein